MYRLMLGKVSALIAGELPSAFIEHAPPGRRQASWLAGRILLSHIRSPLPEIIFGAQGKPAFTSKTPLWFNLSHSGDDIALLVSDEGEVGCDIEVIRPRTHWRALANELFSSAEYAEIAAEQSDKQLAAFWRVWTRKEAIVKQRGGSAWQLASIDSTTLSTLSVSHYQTDSLSLSVCTPTAFILEDKVVEKIA